MHAKQMLENAQERQGLVIGQNYSGHLEYFDAKKISTLGLHRYRRPPNSRRSVSRQPASLISLHMKMSGMSSVMQVNVWCKTINDEALRFPLSRAVC